MKYSLLLKLIIIELTVAIVLFVLFNTIGNGFLKQRFIGDEADYLYEMARKISTEYIISYVDDSFSAESEIQSFTPANYLRALSEVTGIPIWVVSRKGDILINTRDINSSPVNINLIDPDFFSEAVKPGTELTGLMEEPMLSVIFPVVDRFAFTVKGYLVLHCPMSEIEEKAVRYTDILNICLFIFLIILLILLVLIYFIFVYPLNKLVKAAREYGKGNLEYIFSIKTHDSYRDLANTLIFIKDRLKNLKDYQKKFIANISHDFRSPLTSMRGYAQAMIDGTIPPELHEKYLNIILFETERLTKLTSGLLELSNFENQGVMLDIVSFNINSIIKHTAASFEGICKRKKLTLELEFSSEELYVDADLGKIQQVLYNLLDNAIKFSHNDSSVRITVEERGEKAFISVKDHGIGIPQDAVMKVWDRFYKTDLSRGKDKSGTGLGLSITKEIINFHKEQITVTSTEGVGTTFCFTLSISEE